MLDNSFYLEKISQSDYRKFKKKSNEKKSKKYLDLKLQKLNIKDSKLKEALKTHICKRNKEIMNRLLPEETVKLVDTERYLNQIFILLGLM